MLCMVVQGDLENVSDVTERADGRAGRDETGRLGRLCILIRPDRYIRTVY